MGIKSMACPLSSLGMIFLTNFWCSGCLSNIFRSSFFSKIAIFCNISCLFRATFFLYKLHMSILNQRTVNKKISFSGVGLHTGKNVNLDLLPSPPNTGIIFKRIDIEKNNIVIPSFENVIDTTLCTTLSNENGIKISTVEHLMGALYGLGIDNLVVELNAQELPILDGSAKIFIEEILSNGIKLVNNNGMWNDNNADYIFYAIADTPFKTANAR